DGSSSIIRTVASQDIYFAASHPEEVNGQSTILEGERIFITAEYINVNGVIQSGRGEYNLVIDDAMAQRIEGNRPASGQQRDPLLLTDPRSRDLAASYDYGLERIVVQELRASGGYVDLTGRIANTRNGEIRVFGDYAKINIDNQTTYDMEIHRLDVSQRGEGTIIIKDMLKGTPEAPLVTLYEREGDLVHVQEGSSSNRTTERQFSYKPKDKLRLAWTVVEGTRSTTTTRLSKDSLWGLIPNFFDRNDVDSKTVGPTNTVLLTSDRSNDRFYVSTASNDAQPKYRYLPHVTSSVTTTQKYDLKPTWSGWGPWSVKTVHWKLVDVTRKLTLHMHNILADQPIGIQFLGQAEGEIEIQSLGRVFIDGEIRNPNGTTRISSLGSSGQVQLNSADAIIGGRHVDLSATGAIGSDALPINTNIADVPTYDFTSDRQAAVAPGHRVLVNFGHSAGGVPGKVYEYIRPLTSPGRGIPVRQLSTIDFTDTSSWMQVDVNGSVSLTTVMGDIFANEVSGDLFVDQVNANTSGLESNDGDVTLFSQGSIVGINDASKVIGDAIDLTARTGSIGQADQPLQVDNLNARQTLGDSLTAWAAGDSHTKHSGDLVLKEIVAGGDVTMTFDPSSEFGTLIDGNTLQVIDERAQEELVNSVWNALNLLDGDARRTERREALISSKNDSYVTYWNWRNTQADPSVFDATFVIEVSDDEREFFRQQEIENGLVEPELTAKVDERATTVSNSRTQQYRSLHAEFGSEGDVFQPDYQ
ncbi:MAG: hypothetical protein WBD31_10825, partial [Rubripirellula sp.]